MIVANPMQMASRVAPARVALARVAPAWRAVLAPVQAAAVESPAAPAAPAAAPTSSQAPNKEGGAQRKPVSRATTVQKDTIVEGQVERVVDFGAFVRLADGSVGLLHRSQVSQERIVDLAAANVFKEGDKVKALVLRVNQGKDRPLIALSTRVFESEPGQIVKNAEAAFAKAEETLKQRRSERTESDDANRKALAELKVGQIKSGVIRAQRTPFAIVKLDNGATLRLAALQMPEKRPQTGETVKVLITDVKADRGIGDVTMLFTENADGTGTPTKPVAPREARTDAGNGEKKNWQQRPRRDGDSSRGPRSKSKEDASS